MKMLTRPDPALKRVRLSAERPGISPTRLRAIATRILPVGIFFAIAFMIDQLTGQRYSAVFGSAAIVASVLSVLPRVRPAALALRGYGAIWLVFNLGRAGADDAGVALGSQSAVGRFEAALFGGTLPSDWLQERWHDPTRTQVHDVVLALVHASFFVVPFVMAAVLWFRDRPEFGRYCGATALAFAVGLLGFLLLPTAPPWMSATDSVSRVAIQALAIGDGGSALVGGWRREDARLGFEPNHIAAMPSVHVAAAVLVGLVIRAVAPRWSVLGVGYALAMTLAVVYLGEHFVLDALAGWAVALLGWSLASRLRGRFCPG